MLRAVALLTCLLTAAPPIIAAQAAAKQAAAKQVAAAPAADAPAVVLPLQRTAYFMGEQVPLAVTGVADGENVKLEAAHIHGRIVLYEGKPGPLLLDTARLAPGDYALLVNGAAVTERLTLVSPVRPSAAAMMDEALPGNPDYKGEKDPQKRAAIEHDFWENMDATLRETGLTGCVAWAAESTGLYRRNLDTLTRHGAMLLINSDTRPTSFSPIGTDPGELDGMVHRMALTAAANARYPTFGGFCFGWDACGHSVGGRRQLLVYWGWGKQEAALRAYLERIDRQKMDEFTRRTGLQPVGEQEYLAYLLAIGRPEFTPYIDLPSRRLAETLARYVQPMPAAEQRTFEKRLDAWAAYLMGLYNESYTREVAALRAIEPSLRYTSSVQSDHGPVRGGQNYASAYAPLDFRYQSTWNDQVGGPDYAYQWLHVAGLLDIARSGQPVWISNAHAGAHGRAAWPGKLTRVAAHNLIYGASGIGFACEAFSTLTGGMTRGWPSFRDGAGGADVRSGKDFLDRFAGLAIDGRTRGVGILWSEQQYGRQHVTMGFGCAAYQAQVSLARLGYSPRFVTEGDLAQDRAGQLAALVIVGQTVPLPEAAQAGLARFVKAGGVVVVDGNTTLPLPGARKADVAFPFRLPGKTHNMDAPLMVENDANQAALWHRKNGPPLLAALGATGRAPLVPQTGAASPVSVLTIDGGEVTYLVAVNDSYIKTQADWYQVRERLVPAAPLPAGAQMYDVTEEKPLGAAGPLDCDLTATTARVYAILPRAVGATALAATQKVQAGDTVVVRVGFKDAAGGTLKAVVPLHLALKRPDGAVDQVLWRWTGRDGNFAIALPVPANAPAGKWTVEVRCSLTGQVTALPVTVTPAPAMPQAALWPDTVVVRASAAIEAALAKGTEVVVPIADSPQAESLAKVAGELSAALATRGVKTTIWRNPPTTTYTLGYDPSAAELEENAKVDRGEAIGVIKRTTVNGNDWFGGVQSGFRVARPVIILDLVGEKGDAPLAEGGLTKNGILWPAVDAAFPGPGRAVVQAVPWAFTPRASAIVVQAMDLEGLAAGVRALAAGKLPPDRITPSIAATRDALWREYHIGGAPATPAADGLTATGLATRHEPRPFRILFPGPKPPTLEEVTRPETPPVAMPVPGDLDPKKLASLYRLGDGWVNGMTAGFLVPDSRFTEAWEACVTAEAAARHTITIEGVFRYNDRFPRSQPQWETMLDLYRKLVPPAKLGAMAFAVEIEGKAVGELRPAATEEREIPIETHARWDNTPARTVKEEIVTRLAGEIALPAGTTRVRLVHRNVVDGVITRVYIGRSPPPPLPPPPAPKGK